MGPLLGKAVSSALWWARLGLGVAWGSGLPMTVSLTLRACMLGRFSRVQLFATLWAVACQAPLSMGFSRQEYWSVVMPFSRRSSPLRDRVVSPVLQADSLPLSHLGSPALPPVIKASERSHPPLPLSG